MLANRIIELTDAYVRAFDVERPQVLEFRKIHNKGASWAVQSGVGFQGGAALGVIAKGLVEYLSGKADFIKDKLQQSVTATEIEFYPELSMDLKSHFSAYLNHSL